MNSSLPIIETGSDKGRAIPLKSSSNVDIEKKKLFKAAKQMESLFLYQVLKAMRQSIPSTDNEAALGLGGGLGKDIYTQMFDEELADRMAGMSDKSIANVLYRSLEKLVEKQSQSQKVETPSQAKVVTPTAKPILPAPKYIKIEREESIDRPAVAKTQTAKTDDKLSKYDPIIKQTSEKYRLHPELLKSVIKVESNGDPKAISKAGAKGLMQLADTTASDMGVKNVFNPDQNIEGGARYLRHLIDRFKDIKKALAAYNSGPETVKKYDGIPPYPETVKYVETVLDSVQGKQLFY